MNEQDQERQQRKALKRLRRTGTLAELQLTTEDLLKITCIIKCCALHKEDMNHIDRYYTKANGGYMRIFDSDIDEIYQRFKKLSEIVLQNELLVKGAQDEKQRVLAG